MTVRVVHDFVSAIPDGDDATVVRPSNWNADHVIEGLGTAAEADTGDFATAAQGLLADSALQPAAIGVSVQPYDVDLSAWAGVNPSSYSTSAQIAAAYQPLDSDLTALAAAGNSGVLTATTASFTTADETKLDGIEALADVTDATNVAAAGAVMESDTSTASMSFVVDEDDMASNSATKVPTQQSVKAYVDGAEVKEENIDPTPLGFYTTEGSGVRLWKFADRVLVGDAVTYNGGKNGTEMNSAQSDFAANTKIRWTERDAQFIVASTEGITAILGETRSSRRSGYFDASRQRAPVGVAGLGVTDSTDYDSGARAAYFEGWVQHTGGGTHNRGAVGIEISIADSRSGGVQDNPYKGMGSLALGMWISSSLSSELGGTAGPSSSAIKIGLGNDTFYKGLVFNAGAIEGADGATTTGRGRAIEMAIGHEIGWRNGNSGADTPSAGAHIRYTGIGTAGFTGMLLGNRSVQIIGATAYADEKTLLEITAPSSGDADNYLSISAVASPGPPTLSAVGTSTNIDLWMQGKGTGKLVAYHPDTSVSAVTEALQLRHSVTSGTPAAGIGTGLEYVTQNGVGSNKIGMAVHMVSTDVTNGSEDFDFVVRLMENGAAHAERFRVRSSGVIAINGTTVLGTRKTGWAAATGTATRTTFVTSSVTLPQLAERVKALIDDLISHGAIGA